MDMTNNHKNTIKIKKHIMKNQFFNNKIVGFGIRRSDFWGLSILLPAVILLFASCRSTKKIEQPVLSQELMSFSANYSGKIDDGSEMNTFNGQLRFEKGKELWLSVTKFGFEAIRFKMTNDSIYLLNKLDKTVLIRPTNYSKELFGIAVKLDDLQNIFVGKHHLSDKESNFLTVSYNKFCDVSGFHLPEEIKIMLKSFFNSELNIKYSKISVNQVLDFPFSIPDSFVKK
jgi:hypothetical protein